MSRRWLQRRWVDGAFDPQGEFMWFIVSEWKERFEFLFVSLTSTSPNLYGLFKSVSSSQDVQIQQVQHPNPFFFVNICFYQQMLTLQLNCDSQTDHTWSGLEKDNTDIFWTMLYMNCDAFKLRSLEFRAHIILKKCSIFNITWCFIYTFTKNLPKYLKWNDTAIVCWCWNQQEWTNQDQIM